MSRVAFRNFTGGEVTSTLCARYDLKKFGTFLETCRNFLPNLHGDVERRPGTKFIADLGASSILMPFQFNTEPQHNYVLMFQSGHIKIAQADGLTGQEVLDKDGQPGNPYAMSKVYDISFGQVADVLYLAHPDYPLRKITRADNKGVKAAVVIVAGQSNAVGMSEASGTISAGGHFWDNDSGKWTSPVQDPVWPSTTGGFVPALVQKLNQKGRTVYVVNVARGATNCATNYMAYANRNWGPNGTLRERAKAIINSALSAISEPYDVIGTVWLQGETDASFILAELETQSDYNSTVAKTLKYFKDEFGGDVFLSYIAYYDNTSEERDAIVDTINARLKAVAQANSWCHRATTLPSTFRASSKLRGDGVHYLQSAYDELGGALGDAILPYVGSGEYVLPGYVWNISAVKINQSLPAPAKPTVTWHRGENDGDPVTDNETSWLTYQVTAVDADGVESVASPSGRCKGRYPTDWVVGDYVSLSWTAVTDAVEYNIYRESAGYFGFIGTATTNSFTDQNYEPDTAQTPRTNWNPFENGNNPTCVAFHQQRMWLGGGSKNPATVYASRTGDYESFRKSRPLQDDDALEYVLASGSVDDVKWLVSFDSLLIGTAGAEYKASASKTAITPSDCQITVQSYWGSRSLQPLVIGQSIMHCQRAGSHVRDLYYTLESDGYAGNDLSVLAPQLVETHGIKQWCYQQSPVSTVWAVRADGTLLALTYMREQNIFGWSRHVTDGKYRSVAVINGEDEDIVMAVVQRTVNGEAKYYLERVMPRFRDADGIEDAWYVDAGMYVPHDKITRDADGRLVVCSGLSHLAGKTVQVLSNGSPEEHVVSYGGSFSLEFPVAEDEDGNAAEDVKVLVGLGYTSVMAPLPLETDMDKGGSTVGKRRAYGKCVARMYRSVGGSYAASEPGSLWNPDAWKKLAFYELPFLPEKWGQACQPYSGDLEISLPSGQDADTTIWFLQDKPLPMRVVALMTDVEFGEI